MTPLSGPEPMPLLGVEISASVSFCTFGGGGEREVRLRGGKVVDWLE